VRHTGQEAFETVVKRREVVDAARRHHEPQRSAAPVHDPVELRGVAAAGTSKSLLLLGFFDGLSFFFGAPAAWRWARMYEPSMHASVGWILRFLLAFCIRASTTRSRMPCLW